ncbi:MAG: 2-hydroxy-3-oxopropionate reductase [Clostridiales bacterium]|nr:2-hydroxy-3-oxopropionate reductase [Clostridiales bacterium]
MKIGFIGLGVMGKPMCRNLIKAGYSLIVYNRSQAAVEELAAEGAEKAHSAADLASHCDVVITMLPDSPDVKAVILGGAGVLEGAKPGTLIIDMSSIAPAASREVAIACKAKGVRMLDAPVSGGEPKAIDGTLTIMVGGDKADFDAAKEAILLKMGGSAVYCGEIGAGNTTKLANQIIVAANIAACAEAFTLAKKAGVAPETVLDAIKGGLAGSAVMEAKVPMMIAGSYDPGFRINLHIKDLANAVDTAHAFGAPLQVAPLVMEMLQWLNANSCGALDHSAIYRFYEFLAGGVLGEA